jgi:hypothetical protein
VGCRVSEYEQSQFVFDDVWIPLSRSKMPLTSKVEVSDLLSELVEDFDYKTTGQSNFYPYVMPDLPQDFGIGLIVGASGSGKSTLLSSFGQPKKYVWDGRAIADHFDSANSARSLFMAAGLCSVPTWVKPYSVLSNGEKFRADLAVAIKDGAVIDEFSSVVDRATAISSSKSLSRHVSENGVVNVVIASCHRDVIPYLKPDWIIDTDAGMYCIRPRECLRQKSLVVDVYEVKSSIWEFYAKHHYLTANISPFARCFVGVVSGVPAVFYSVITNPAGTLKNAYRGHRLVTLPDYQGLGLGPRMSDFVANFYVLSQKRFFGKTAHSRLGEYRQRSKEWRPTSKNLKRRTDAKQVHLNRELRFQTWLIDEKRLTYSHEFVKGVE